MNESSMRALNRTALVLGVIQMAISAAAYRCGVSSGMLGSPGRWDGVWQTIHTKILLENPLQSIWYLHAQPPGYSCWGWLLLQAGGVEGLPSLLRIMHVLLGGMTVILTFKLLFVLTDRYGWALAGGMIMLFNPALVYFQAYVLYEMLLICILTTSVWLFWKTMTECGTRWLIAWLVLLNILVMTRSLFHLIYPAVALLFAVPVLKRFNRKQTAALIFAAILLPSAWYMKNFLQYGFFGASSWYGLSLFKTAASVYTTEELDQLKKEGVIDGWTKQDPFLSDLTDYRNAGFDRYSEITILSQGDFHDRSVPDISRAYVRNSRRLIHHHFPAYLAAVHDGFTRFCRPASTFEQLNPFRGKLFWEQGYNHLFSGQGVSRYIARATGFDPGSMIYGLYPVLILAGGGYVVRGVFRLRGSDPNLQQARQPAVLLTLGFMLFTMLYVAVVGCLFENGENERFRFSTEPMMLVTGLVFLQRIVSYIQGKI
jgi:4-amino-4-deoxy-L-arabinose transferase-like glycosyltransferase